MAAFTPEAFGAGFEALAAEADCAFGSAFGDAFDVCASEPEPQPAGSPPRGRPPRFLRRLPPRPFDDELWALI
jgi:hypothetical protein